MMTKFYEILPLNDQYLLLKRNKVEYHIYMEDSDDATSRDLWLQVKHYLSRAPYRAGLFEIGIDKSYNNKHYFLWMHVYFQNHDKFISNVIHDLNANFIAKYRMPSLVTLITNNFVRDEKSFTLAICEFQDQYGKDSTKHVLEIYYRDIKPYAL